MQPILKMQCISLLPKYIKLILGLGWEGVGGLCAFLQADAGLLKVKNIQFKIWLAVSSLYNFRNFPSVVPIKVIMRCGCTVRSCS
jgi:hypothetical protein